MAAEETGGATGLASGRCAPQQTLYLRPLPHGQRSFRPGLELIDDRRLPSGSRNRRYAPPNAGDTRQDGATTVYEVLAGLSVCFVLAAVAMAVQRTVLQQRLVFGDATMTVPVSRWSRDTQTVAYRDGGDEHRSPSPSPLGRAVGPQLHVGAADYGARMTSTTWTYRHTLATITMA
jgi:hypothetical protein